MSIPADVRPASVAVREGADLVLRRLREGAFGCAAGLDARALQQIRALDRIATELEQLELLRGRMTQRRALAS